MGDGIARQWIAMAMALSSADEQWNSIPKLGSGKARTRWRRDGRAWFSIVAAKHSMELLRSRKENEMKYELIMGEKAATIEFADDMTVGELEVVKETLLKMLAQRTVELKKAQANSLPVTASIDSMYPALAPRTRNVLKRNGCNTIEDVLNCTPTDLKQMRNMGKRSLEEIEERFSKYGTFKETEANQ